MINLEKAKVVQNFLHTYVQKELIKTRELLNIKSLIISNLGKALYDELDSHNIKLKEEQLAIQLNGSMIEIFFVEEDDKEKDTQVANIIWRYYYENAKRDKFPQNCPKEAYEIIDEFMETVISKTGNEIQNLIEQIKTDLKD